MCLIPFERSELFSQIQLTTALFCILCFILKIIISLMVRSCVIRHIVLITCTFVWQQWRDPHPSLLLHEAPCTTDDVILGHRVEEGPGWLQPLQQLRQGTEERAAHDRKRLLWSAKLQHAPSDEKKHVWIRIYFKNHINRLCMFLLQAADRKLVPGVHLGKHIEGTA